MAKPFAVYSVGESLIRYLSAVYPKPMQTIFPCNFRLLSSHKINDETPVEDNQNTLTLFLYRLTVNQHLRNAGAALQPSALPLPLALDLHYLMTVWTDDVAAEQTIMTWAMRELHLHPVMDVSSLVVTEVSKGLENLTSDWTATDTIQLIPAELTNEDMMRIWDALLPPYRTSVSYIARVVRVEPDASEDSRPVVAARFSLTDQAGGEK